MKAGKLEIRCRDCGEIVRSGLHRCEAPGLGGRPADKVVSPTAGSLTKLDEELRAAERDIIKQEIQKLAADTDAIMMGSLTASPGSLTKQARWKAANADKVRASQRELMRRRRAAPQGPKGARKSRPAGPRPARAQNGAGRKGAAPLGGE